MEDNYQGDTRFAACVLGRLSDASCETGDRNQPEGTGVAL